MLHKIAKKMPNLYGHFYAFLVKKFAKTQKIENKAFLAIFRGFAPKNVPADSTNPFNIMLY